MRNDIDPNKVNKQKCSTCPFGENGEPTVRAMVEVTCLTEANQICHHPRLHGKPETHLCRGARDYQLEVYHRLGVLPEPTDKAWKETLERLKNEQ